MQFLLTITYMIGIVALAYLGCAASAWAYELRIDALYRSMRKRKMRLEEIGLSMAVLHAKAYKITEDHRKKISEFEKRQRFIVEKLLFLKKGTLKTKPPHQLGMSRG